MKCKHVSIGYAFVTVFFLCIIMLCGKPVVAHADSVNVTDLDFNSSVRHNCALYSIQCGSDDSGMVYSANDTQHFNRHWKKCLLCGREYDNDVHNRNIQYWTMGSDNCNPLNSAKIMCDCGFDKVLSVNNRNNDFIPHKGPLFLNSNESYHVWSCGACYDEVSSREGHHGGSVCDVCGVPIGAQGGDVSIYPYAGHADTSKYENEGWGNYYAGGNCSYQLRCPNGWNPISSVNVTDCTIRNDGSYHISIDLGISDMGLYPTDETDQVKNVDGNDSPAMVSVTGSGGSRHIEINGTIGSSGGEQIRLMLPCVSGLDPYRNFGIYVAFVPDTQAPTVSDVQSWDAGAKSSNGWTSQKIIHARFQDNCANSVMAEVSIPSIGYYSHRIIGLVNGEAYVDFNVSCVGEVRAADCYVRATDTVGNRSNPNISGSHCTMQNLDSIAPRVQGWCYSNGQVVNGYDGQGHTSSGVEMPSGTTVYNGVNYEDVYDFKTYREKNPDVAAAYGSDDRKALEHFVIFGMSEGRVASNYFDVNVYRSRNADLQAVYGNDLKQYYNHYILYGKHEGRVASTYNIAKYNYVLQGTTQEWSKSKSYDSYFADNGSGATQLGIMMNDGGRHGYNTDMVAQNGNHYYTATDTMNFTGDVYGSKDIAIFATDAVGTTKLSALRVYNIDNTAPVVDNAHTTISSPTNAGYADIYVSATDWNTKLGKQGSGTAGYQFAISRSADPSTITKWTDLNDNHLRVTDGGWWYIFAKDYAGNVSKPVSGKGKIWVTVWNTVTFDARGGDGDIGTTNGQFSDGSRYQTRKYQYGTTYANYPSEAGKEPTNTSALPVPKRVGYTFIGWFTTPQSTCVTRDANGSYYSDTSTNHMITASTKIPKQTSTTLYAHWKANTYIVSFDSNAQNGAGTVTGTMNPMTFTVDVKQNLTPNAFSKVTTGHVVYKDGQLVAIDSSFKGWDRNPMVIRVGNTMPTYADNAKVWNLTYTNNDRVTLYAIWDDSPRFYKDGNGYVHNEYPDRQFSLADAQAGRITEEELLRTVVVYDRESNPMRNKTSADVAATGDMGVTLFNYSADEFTTLTQPANISITYKAKDESNICAYYTITVYVTSNDANASETRDFVRNISSKYQTLAPEDGGLSSDSWWRTNDFYHSQLESALNGSDTTYEHTFSSDDLNNIREYVERNGFGNAEHDDALQNLYDQYR